MRLARQLRPEDLGLERSAEVLEEAFALSEEEKKGLEELYKGKVPVFSSGKLLVGKVVEKKQDAVYLDIGYKSLGKVQASEFAEYEFEKIKVGDEIEVLLDRLEDENGNVVLSYQKAKSMRAWERIMELFEKDEPVRGIVVGKVKGGLSVDIGVTAFLPGSQVDLHRVTDFDQYVGQEIICKILKVNRRRGNIIVSRRKYLEELRAEQREKLLSTLEEGQVIKGIVKNITNYGAFVDIGGIDGLLHITDMSWSRIAHPTDMVQIGQEVTVKVLSFDKETGKISLGMKQLEESPWEKVGERYKVGDVLTGKVSSIADYGLFVEIEKGIEGLVHISEISWTERVTNLKKHFQIGQEVKVVIVALDVEGHRMSLSIKRLTEDPWKTVGEKVHVGDIIEGPISNITDFGLFVRVMDGVDGLVHISDISWTEHVLHPGDIYKKGDIVKAVVLAVDPENKKISLGIKQLQPDPWKEITQRYPVGKVVKGEVTKITNFGAFVKLEDNLEGLIHISELGDNVDKVGDILKVGEVREFKVIKSSEDEHKIGLSIRALNEPVTAEAPAAAEEGSEEKKQKEEVKSSEATAKAEQPAKRKEKGAAAKAKAEKREASSTRKSSSTSSSAGAGFNTLQEALKQWKEESSEGEEAAAESSQEKAE